MDRASLEKRATELGLKFDGRTSDSKLNDLIEQAGHRAAAANAEQGARFAEPRGPESTVAVDPPQEFQPNPEMDKVQQAEKVSEKLFPVKLLKNYRPVSAYAQIQGDDGIYRALTAEEETKIEAGKSILLPKTEAQDVLSNRIAERNDPLA